jgi:WXG100 family type VII secretion target
MATVKVTSEQLYTLSTNLKSGSDQVQGELATMRSQVAPLATDWQGAASANFQQLWQEWEQGAKQIQDALNGISILLVKAAQTYDSAEGAIAQSMTS